MKRPIERFSDLLERLQGGLEIFRHPVRDLALRYGGAYEADAVFILQKLAEFAGRSGETLNEVLAFYRSYIEQVAEERQELLRSSGRPGAGAVPWDDRFKREYLYALTLSTVLNRSRYELLHDFRQTLAQHGAGAGRILEVGAGNCLNAALASSYGRVEAFEKNEMSLMWHHILDLAGKVDLRIEEYGFGSPQAYDRVVMIELLEHLTDPAAYLRGALRVLKDGGLSYFTFAVRMPQVDHLFDFRSIRQCRDLLAENGFAVVRDRCLVDTYLPFEEEERWVLAEDPRQAVVYCCLARKREPARAGRLLQGFNEDIEV